MTPQELRDLYQELSVIRGDLYVSLGVIENRMEGIKHKLEEMKEDLVAEF